MLMYERNIFPAVSEPITITVIVAKARSESTPYRDCRQNENATPAGKVPAAR